MDYKDLITKAKKASKKAYAPYSSFKVGACVLTEDGKTFCGCNFENSSYGLSICAERNAIGTMVFNEKLVIKAIAIYSPNEENCLPCGACRQVLSEFRGKNDIDVITEIDGKPKVYKLNYLMPESFKL